MSRRNCGALFLVFSACLLLTWTTGCGSGGGGTASLTSGLALTPEDSVKQIVANWEKVGGASIGIDSDGKPTAVLVGQTTTSAATATVTFQDLSGESWTFRIIGVTYDSEESARVLTTYVFQDLSAGEVQITFHMLKSEGAWLLEDITVLSLPQAVSVQSGIQGYVTDKNSGAPVPDARIDLWQDQYLGSTSTAPDGSYGFSDLTPVFYTIVIARDGYEDQTITGIAVL